jgi:DhnA family fructose-bisphosphate aldolase class Ia
MLETYAIHSFRVSHQYRMIKAKRESLPSDAIMLHVDFSENYASKWAKEIQAAHFGSSHNQITIHQGIFYSQVHSHLYFKTTMRFIRIIDILRTSFQNHGAVSFATISDDYRKSASAVAAHLKSIMQEAVNYVTTISKVLNSCNEYGISNQIVN